MIDKEVDLTTNLASILHEVSSQCSKDVNFILPKIQKAALKGKNHIRIKCAIADYKCLGYGSELPKTPLCNQLLKLGFILKREYDFGLFGCSYYLEIYW